jgi:uncharacterized membrane protein
MAILVLAFLIGAIAGLRSMTAPAAVSWAAHLQRINLGNSALNFLSSPITVGILTLLMIGELINDKLPKTPSRKATVPFTGRIVTGALSGAAIGAASDMLIGGLVAGVAGAVAGTLGGYEFRRRLVMATGGKDLPIALLEDFIAVVGAFWIVFG